MKNRNVPFSLRTYSKVPATVAGVSRAKAIAVGSDYSCALISDGTVRCWGGNVVGQLGTGALTGAMVPSYQFAKLIELTSFPIAAPVVGLSSAVGIAAGNLHTCTVLSDGSARCWGDSDHGELGDEGTTQSATPVQVAAVAQ
ncbi:MAG: hypothetical protein HYY13_13715 [Nitrospirae bacterium]|nr:hypothetical protein [Nitrospirota bacterium]